MKHLGVARRHACESEARRLNTGKEDNRGDPASGSPCRTIEHIPQAHEAAAVEAIESRVERGLRPKRRPPGQVGRLVSRRIRALQGLARFHLTVDLPDARCNAASLASDLPLVRPRTEIETLQSERRKCQARSGIPLPSTPPFAFGALGVPCPADNLCMERRCNSVCA